jgi:hypothetical protein
VAPPHDRGRSFLGLCLRFRRLAGVAGELLRVVLKHSAGSEILGPSIVFLAGVLLIDPQWGSGMAFAVGLVCITITTVWGKTSPPQFQRTAATESVSRASSPPDATPSS